MTYFFIKKNFTAKYHKSIVFFDKVVIKQRKCIFNLLRLVISSACLSLSVYVNVICFFFSILNDRQMNEIYKFIMQSNASFIFFSPFVESSERVAMFDRM